MEEVREEKLRTKTYSIGSQKYVLSYGLGNAPRKSNLSSPMVQTPQDSNITNEIRIQDLDDKRPSYGLKLTSSQARAPVPILTNDTLLTTTTHRQLSDELRPFGSVPKSSDSLRLDSVEEISSPSNSKKASGVKGKTGKQQKMVEQFRARFRRQLVESAEREAHDRRLLMAKSSEMLEKEYESRMTALIVERDQAREAMENMQTEIKTLKGQVSEMEMRIRDMMNKEADLSQRLNNYQEYERIFRGLAEHFDYSSPEEAVHWTDTLHRQQNILHQQIEIAELKATHSEEQLNNLQREMEIANKQYNTKCAELEASKLLIESQLKTVQKSLNETNSKVRELTHTERAYYSLVNEINDWFLAWRKRTQDMMENDDSLIQCEGDPIAMIHKLSRMAQLFTPSQAGSLYRDMSNLANHIWADIFPTDEAIRGNPKQIFIKLNDIARNKIKESTTQQRIINELKEDLKNAKTDLSNMRRENLRNRLDGSHNSNIINSSASTNYLSPHNSPIHESQLSSRSKQRILF